MVKVGENIMQLFKKHRLVSTIKLEPMLVGIHPRNRDGYGMNSEDVRDLIDSSQTSDSLRAKYMPLVWRLSLKQFGVDGRLVHEGHKPLWLAHECCASLPERASPPQQRTALLGWPAVPRQAAAAKGHPG